MKSRLRNSLLTSFVLIHAGASAQVVVYSEDFTGQNGKGAFGNSADGITTDTSGVTWTIDVANGGLDGDSTTNDWRVINEAFNGQDMGGEVAWFSPIVDVSSFTQISNISIDVREQSGGANASPEGFSFSYSLNGGTDWVDIFNSGFDGDNTDGSTTISSTFQTISLASPVAVTTNTDFRLRVLANINGANDGYIFDNISASAVPEPSAFALLAGMLAFTGVLMRRRRA